MGCNSSNTNNISELNDIRELESKIYTNKTNISLNTKRKNISGKIPKYIYCSLENNKLTKYKNNINTDIAEHIVGIDTIKERDDNNIPYNIIKDGTRRVEIKVILISINDIVRMCPIREGYYKKCETNDKSICINCLCRKSRHTKIKLIKTKKYKPVRMYTCYYCKNIPQDLIFDADIKHIPEQISNAYTKYICLKCQISNYKNKNKDY